MDATVQQIWNAWNSVYERSLARGDKSGAELALTVMKQHDLHGDSILDKDYSAMDAEIRDAKSPIPDSPPDKDPKPGSNPVTPPSSPTDPKSDSKSDPKSDPKSDLPPVPGNGKGTPLLNSITGEDWGFKEELLKVSNNKGDEAEKWLTENNYSAASWGESFVKDKRGGDAVTYGSHVDNLYRALKKDEDGLAATSGIVNYVTKAGSIGTSMEDVKPSKEAHPHMYEIAQDKGQQLANALAELHNGDLVKAEAWLKEKGFDKAKWNLSFVKDDRGLPAVKYGSHADSLYRAVWKEDSLDKIATKVNYVTTSGSKGTSMGDVESLAKDHPRVYELTQKEDWGLLQALAKEYGGDWTKMEEDLKQRDFNKSKWDESFVKDLHGNPAIKYDSYADKLYRDLVGKLEDIHGTVNYAKENGSRGTAMKDMKISETEHPNLHAIRKHEDWGFIEALIAESKGDMAEAEKWLKERNFDKSKWDASFVNDENGHKAVTYGSHVDDLNRALRGSLDNSKDIVNYVSKDGAKGTNSPAAKAS